MGDSEANRSDNCVYNCAVQPVLYHSCSTDPLHFGLSYAAHGI